MDGTEVGLLYKKSQQARINVSKDVYVSGRAHRLFISDVDDLISSKMISPDRYDPFLFATSIYHGRKRSFQESC